MLMELLNHHSNFPLNIKWDYTQVDFVNPTDNAVTIDIFNAITISNFNTSPSGSSFPNTISFQALIPLETNFIAFCPVNQFLYVAKNTGNIVSVYDSVNNVFVTNIAVPTTITGQLVYDSVNNRMYGGTSIGTIVVIDCATNTVLTSVSTGAFSPIQGLDFSAANNSVYCTQPLLSQAYRIDCSTNLVVNTLSVNLFTPRAVKYNPTTNKVYFFNTTLSTITVADSVIGFISSVPIPNPAANTPACDYVPSLNSIYYQQSGTFDILQFECSTLTINPVIIPFPVRTFSIIYNPISDLLYVSKSIGISMDGTYIYNPATNGLVQFVPAPTDNYGVFSVMALQTVKNSIYTVSRGVVIGNSGIYELTASNSFYIVSPYNYNALLQDIQTSPMLVRRIVLITETQEQFAQPFSIMHRDANGIQVVKPRLPNIELSVNQAQPNIASIDFKPKELILDDNTMFSQYTFPKKSVTRILLFYKQISRLDFLTSKVSNCSPLENYLSFKEAVNVSEAKLRDESTQPLIIQNVKNEEKKHMRLAGKMKMMDKLKKR